MKQNYEDKEKNYLYGIPQYVYEVTKSAPGESGKFNYSLDYLKTNFIS